MARRDKGRITGCPVTTPISSPAGGVRLETFIPWTLVKRGVKRQVITPIGAPDAFRVEAVAAQRQSEAELVAPIVRALGLAHYWQHLLDTGKVGSLTEIAAAEGMDLGQVSRIVRLTQIAPDAVEACLAEENNAMAQESLNRLSFQADRRK